jgi:hypothetical protein
MNLTVYWVAQIYRSYLNGRLNLPVVDCDDVHIVFGENSLSKSNWLYKYIKRLWFQVKAA